ncbi:MAG: aminotransferase class I/II-fold pyridoxal phosphate-dependent enzyme [Hyphomicrobiales bacterium]|nr:aminotransferase class I/II-fold pyridoxal phosphate-dependent enzyme [Hyphomicrobiales bacterium]
MNLSPSRKNADRLFTQSMIDNPMMKRVRRQRQNGHFPYYIEQVPVGLNQVRVNGRQLIQLGSSNYLGLAQDPRINAAVRSALEQYGTSSTSSRLLTGTRPLHHELERSLAAFLGKEDALVFPTGYLANVGAIPAIVGRNDAVFYDAEVHACLIDGIRLSGATAMRFRHNDVADLERRLQSCEADRKLVVVDSLYSLAADLADLTAMIEVTDEAGAWIFLDDAHGCGVLGPGGRGLAHALSVSDRVPVIMGVFSKSFASTGGFVAGSAALIDHLRFNARSYLFSNAIAPAQAAAALAALEILVAEPELPTRALALAERARTALGSMGWPVAGQGTQMVPILLGSDDLCFRATHRLAVHGVNVSPAVHPGVPKGKDLLRIGFPPTLMEDEFRDALAAFARAAADLPEALTGAPQFQLAGE